MYNFFSPNKGLTANSGGRSQSQMSAFDEDNLNVSQFVQLTETFLGDGPADTGFSKLLSFLREGYEETEDEKMERLMKVGIALLHWNLFLGPPKDGRN